MEALNPDYRPSSDEPYMSPRQLEYFKTRLLEWRKKVRQEYEQSYFRMREEKTRDADLVDQGASEVGLQMDLKSRERALNLLVQIDAALKRVEEGTYGYCEETGEEIGIKRLEARPLATLCVEAQEKMEQLARMHGAGRA
jgi:DnaK suppressor protein